MTGAKTESETQFMIEILILVHFCKKLGVLCRSRGRKAGWFQFLLVISWFGGEFFAGIFAGIVCMIASGRLDEEPPFVIIYISALLGAGLGAWSTFLLVKMLPDLSAADAQIEDRTCSGCGEPLQRRATSCPLCGKMVRADA